MIKFNYKSSNSVLFWGEINNLRSLTPRLNGTNEGEKQVYDDQAYVCLSKYPPQDINWEPLMNWDMDVKRRKNRVVVYLVKNFLGTIPATKDINMN